MASEVVHLRLPHPPLVRGMPQDVAQELDYAFDRAFPWCLSLAKGQPLWLRYGVTGHGLFVSEPGPSYREIVGWLCDGPCQIGMVRLREWHIPPCVRDRDLFWAADGHSQDTHDFARAVLSVWPIRRLACHGSLLEVCRVWMAPEHARNSLWATAINGLIKRRYTRGYAAMLLVAYPDDYKADTINVDVWQGMRRWETGAGRHLPASRSRRWASAPCLGVARRTMLGGSGDR